VIDQLKKIGCSTAKNVLATSRERLIREADLEEDTVDEVLAILRYEFEDEDDEEVDETTGEPDETEEKETEKETEEKEEV
jgi:N utilization substance protein A